MRSIVVPVHNGARHLRWLCPALLQQLADTDEVIIVDDGSADGSRDYIEALSDDRFRVLRHETPRGFAAAVNAGIDVVSGDVVALLNHDTIPDPGFIDTLATQVTTDSSIGALSGTLFFPHDDTVQHAGVSFTETNHTHFFRHLPRGHALLTVDRNVQGFAFAACVFRKDVLDSVGHFDERYVNSYEDFDYGFRLQDQGYRLRVSHQATAFHWERQSGPIRSIRRKDNVARLWSRWGDRIQPDLASYVAESTRYLANAEQLPAGPVAVMNLASTAMAWDVITYFQNDFNKIANGGLVSEAWDCWREGVAADKIWLPLAAPAHTISHPEPIVYVVDRFPQLAENAYWLQTRCRFGVNDLVADTCGNVIPLKWIVQSGSAVLHDD